MMQTVTIDVSSMHSTGLNQAFSSVHSIEIDATPVGQGGFGVVHCAHRFDGAAPADPQVIKLLLDNGNGTARKGFDTIRELQQRLQSRHLEARRSGRDLLELHPALHGVPQFSFEGRLNGRPAIGYSANDLGAAGMEDFGKILENDAKIRRFQSLPISSRMMLAAQLVDAFQFLSADACFIHADVKPEAIFVDTAKLRLAIIDFDSGAVVRDPSDRPTTFGTRQDWLAPEIMAQLDAPGNHTRIVKVDLQSDVWAVNVGIHYLLLGGLHPLFFLKEISDRSVSAYFKQFKWPDVKAGFAHLNASHLALHAKYCAFLRGRIPHEVQRQLAFTINHGFLKPSARTTYGQWKTVLDVANRPTLKKFEVDRTFIDDARPVRLSWDVTGAVNLQLSGVGDVTGRSSIDVQVRRDTTFVLTLTSQNGARIERRVKVVVSRKAPTIHAFTTDRAMLITAVPARFTWKVSGAERIEIDHGVGDVTGRAFAEVLPRQDSTYTIRAISPFGVTATARIAIAVSRKAPVISAFAADRTYLPDPSPVELSWRVSSDSHSVHISGIGTVPQVGKIRVWPKRDTTFTLEAISYFGQSSKSDVAITVSKAAPQIELFQVSPPVAVAGTESELRWRVRGAASVQIDPGWKNLQPEGRRRLSLQRTQEFVLRAQSAFGVESLSKVSARVLTPTQLNSDRSTLLRSAGESIAVRGRTELAASRLTSLVQPCSKLRTRTSTRS